MKEYILKPNMTFKTLSATSTLDKPAVLRPTLPPRQPLPTPVRQPERPALKLGAGRASAIHHGRGTERSHQFAGAAQIHPRRTRRPSQALGRRRLPGLLCAGILRLWVRTASATGGGRSTILSHHAHRAEWQTQDRQARRPRVVSAAGALAGGQSRRTLAHPHSQ